MNIDLKSYEKSQNTRKRELELSKKLDENNIF